jgi:hypothetical protein
MSMQSSTVMDVTDNGKLAAMESSPSTQQTRTPSAEMDETGEGERSIVEVRATLPGVARV